MFWISQYLPIGSLGPLVVFLVRPEVVLLLEGSPAILALEISFFLVFGVVLLYLAHRPKALVANLARILGVHGMDKNLVAVTEQTDNR